MINDNLFTNGSVCSVLRHRRLCGGFIKKYFIVPVIKDVITLSYVIQRNYW